MDGLRSYLAVWLATYKTVTGSNNKAGNICISSPTCHHRYTCARNPLHPSLPCRLALTLAYFFSTMFPLLDFHTYYAMHMLWASVQSLQKVIV